MRDVGDVSVLPGLDLRGEHRASTSRWARLACLNRPAIGAPQGAVLHDSYLPL